MTNGFNDRQILPSYNPDQERERVGFIFRKPEPGHTKETGRMFSYLAFTHLGHANPVRVSYATWRAFQAAGYKVTAE